MGPRIVKLTLAAVAIWVAAILPAGDHVDAVGMTISVPDSAGDVGLSAVLLLDSSGNPVITYVDGTNLTIKLVRCGNLACTSGNVMFTAVNFSDGVAFDVELDPLQNPVIAYSDSSMTVKLLHCGNATCSAGNTTNTIDSGTSGFNYLSLVLDPSSNPVVSYQSSDTTGLKVARCSDPECLLPPSVTSPDTAGDVGWFSSIALDSNSFPVVSYHRLDLGDLKVLHCGSEDCTSGNTITTPATYGGQDTSLRLDALGRPVISYTSSFGALNGSPKDLKVLHCGDTTCSAGNTTFGVDVDNHQPFATSLQLDASGRPLVTYVDNLPFDLKLLKCGDPACSSSQIVRLDVATNVGFSTSMALDASGYPIVAYYDNDNANLNVLRCISCIDDTDSDGCLDGNEKQTEPGSQLYGGRRSVSNPNDYFNPSHDGQNRVDDILLVVQQYFDDDSDGNPGLPPYEPGYNPDTDRTLVGPNAWNLGPPNGLQRVDDILNQVKQYFHDCS